MHSHLSPRHSSSPSERAPIQANEQPHKQIDKQTRQPEQTYIQTRHTNRQTLCQTDKTKRYTFFAAKIMKLLPNAVALQV